MIDADPTFIALVADNLDAAVKHDCSDDWLIMNRHEIARKLIAVTALLVEAATDLETYVSADWPERLRTHSPMYSAKYDRDMELVRRIRAAIAEKGDVR